MAEFIKKSIYEKIGSNNNVKTINIAADFSPVVSGRKLADGPYSGERFRLEFMLPALNNYDLVIVNLDDVLGYSVAFLDDAFGGLVEIDRIDTSILLEKLMIQSRRALPANAILRIINSKSAQVISGKPEIT
jgi:STAS-like domain of unknown function (DUF4325)